MDNQYGKLIFGIISLLIGIVFLFQHNRIIKIQGESKDGDYSEEIRIKKFKVAGIMAILGGIFLLFQYFNNLSL